ncbi:MAG: LOG family protein [Myxococcales bacterium]|nr:LOG family protein [Myxococcales bacterium]
MPVTEKAYKNLDFLTSSEARPVRILCEYEEPQRRFQTEGVRDTVVVFGSARVTSQAESAEALSLAQLAVSNNVSSDPGHVAELDRVRVQAERQCRIARYYEETRELAERVTRWSMARERQYLICSGGGPGIMEAANRGAADVVGGRSVALGISLPFEEKVNRFATPELAFEFHYFFMRKYWFAYLAKAMVIMPGGFGTLDEMCEVLTLRQTGKIKKLLPIVLYGTDYWDQVLNVGAMVDWGTISAKDLSLMHRSDSVDDAFQFLTTAIEANETSA